MHLPVVGQRALAAALSAASTRRLARRTERLPPLGPHAAVHVSAVLRIPTANAARLDLAHALPAARGHYRYPDSSLHITVANLDRAKIGIGAAADRLRTRRLSAPAVRLAGFGCSPDTVFIRCHYGDELARLRRAVREEFGVPRAGRISDVVFQHLAFVNVMRFDGAGVPPPPGGPIGTVVLGDLEIVRTDRYLSGVGTTLLARVPLVH